jgi:hypothetical protein
MTKSQQQLTEPDTALTVTLKSLNDAVMTEPDTVLTEPSRADRASATAPRCWRGTHTSKNGVQADVERREGLLRRPAPRFLRALTRPSHPFLRTLTRPSHHPARDVGVCCMHGC